MCPCVSHSLGTHVAYNVLHVACLVCCMLRNANCAVRVVLHVACCILRLHAVCGICMHRRLRVLRFGFCQSAMMRDSSLRLLRPCSCIACGMLHCCVVHAACCIVALLLHVASCVLHVALFHCCGMHAACCTVALLHCCVMHAACVIVASCTRHVALLHVALLLAAASSNC